MVQKELCDKRSIIQNYIYRYTSKKSYKIKAINFCYLFFRYQATSVN